MNRNAEFKADKPMSSIRKGDKLFFNKLSSDAANNLKGYRHDQSGGIYEKLNQIKKTYKEDFNRNFSNESFKGLPSHSKSPYPKHGDLINLLEESDENEHDIDSNSQRSAFRRLNSVHSPNDTPRSRAPSMHSGDADFFKESFLTAKLSSTIISNSLKEEKDVNTEVIPSFGSGGGGGGGRKQMNFIMLVGLFAGLLITKALEYLQLYFEWFLNQIMHLRNALLGGLTILEFMNMDDNSRYHRHTKWLLIPFIGMCSILYGLITILCVTIHFLLNAAPKGLSNFVQKLCY